uniref:CSON003783 protein n=1 Tax=Culicoides sonorensis TaxID=179676 RepID=A0A336MRW3_CULSO
MTSSDCLALTICDIEAERNCKNALKTFAKETVQFVEDLKGFLDSEKSKVNKMWQLSYKIQLLSSLTFKCLNFTRNPLNLYPPEVTETVLTEMVSELNSIVNGHGSKLIDVESHLNNLTKSHRKFTSSCFQLDWTLDLGIIRGNESQKPLKYFMNTGNDVITESKLITLNLRTAFDAIQLADSITFENYKKTFVLADDFLNLLNEFLQYHVKLNHFPV